MSAESPRPQPRTRRSPGYATRRLAERLFLGTLMSLIAFAVDRRLRRAFTKR